MTEGSKQIQKAGDDSLNIQAGQINITKGLSVEDVKTIALDVFKSNFYTLSGVARDTAQKRAEEITNTFLDEFAKRNPEGLIHAEDPDMQYAIFTAQKEYARTGDKELGDILIDILVDRTKESSRSILQIVLNECLKVAPKLTKSHLDALSIIFNFRYVKYLRMRNLESLTHYLDYRVSPFAQSLVNNAACYQHLAYAGCGSISIGSAKIEAIFRKTYPGIFAKGFPGSEISEIVTNNPVSQQMFTQCLRDPQLFQVNAIDEQIIRSRAKENNLDDVATQKIVDLQNRYLMSEAEVKDYLKSAHVCMERVFDVWDDSSIKNMTLTSVGIALGHANIRRITGETDDLSIWIN